MTSSSFATLLSITYFDIWDRVEKTIASLWNSLGDSNEELKYHDKYADLLNELFHKIIIDESERIHQNKNL